MNLENHSNCLKQGPDSNIDTPTILSQSMNVLYGQQNDFDEITDHRSPDYENGSSNQSLSGENMNSVQIQSRDSDANGMPQWAKGMCKQLDCIQKQLTSQTETQNRRWATVENQLQNQNVRMTSIESQVSQIGVLQNKVAEIDCDVILMKADHKSMREKVEEHDKSLQYHSQVSDDLIEKNIELSQKVDDLSDKYDYLLKQQASINIKQTSTDEKLIDLQWRSMRENLLFTGLSESAVYPNNENCESKIKEFIRNELHIEKNILFDRVHRLGRYSPAQRFPRPIVAKFTYYADKELVRRAAPANLIGSRFRVKEHFPRGARASSSGYLRERGQFGNGPNDLTFGSNIPTRNRYDGLRNDEPVWSTNDERDNPWDRQTTFAGKRKPTSPVDTDISTKRQTEYTNDTSTQRISMDYEHSLDETVSASGDTVTRDTATQETRL